VCLSVVGRGIYIYTRANDGSVVKILIVDSRSRVTASPNHGRIIAPTFDSRWTLSFRMVPRLCEEVWCSAMESTMLHVLGKEEHLGGMREGRWKELGDLCQTNQAFRPHYRNQPTQRQVKSQSFFINPRQSHQSSIKSPLSPSQDSNAHATFRPGDRPRFCS
jgi:hypothetical protein